MDASSANMILTIADLREAASLALPSMVRGAYSSMINTSLFVNVIH